MINAVKELKIKNDELKKENKSLKNEIENIKNYICSKDPQSALCSK